MSLDLFRKKFLAFALRFGSSRRWKLLLKELDGFIYGWRSLSVNNPRSLLLFFAVEWELNAL